MYLDTIRGEMIIDELKCDDESMDMKEYFDFLKEQYRSLNMIKIPTEHTIEIRDSQEAAALGEVNETLVFSQTDSWFPTSIDIQWIKQIFWSHGWPDNFRKDEALKVLNEFAGRRTDIDVQ